MTIRAHHTGDIDGRRPDRAAQEELIGLIVVDVLEPIEPLPPTDLGRAIRRMYPTLARVAVAICRLHARRLRPEDSRPASQGDR